MGMGAVRRSDDSLERKIRAEQIRVVYLHSPTTTTGSLVAGAFLMWVARGRVPVGVIVAWGAALLVHQAVRIYHYRAFLRADPDPAESEHWGRLYILATTVAGCIWGATGLLFYAPDSVEEQTYLAFILFGIVSMTIPSISIYAPAFYPLVVLVLAPFLVRAMLSGTSAELTLAIPLVIALGMAMMFGRKINLLVHESIRRRFENVELIELLAREKEIAEKARADAEAANRSKTRFFAAAGHDLRQPLHAMGLFAVALAEKLRDPEVRGLVNNINASVEALEGLFNELLDISKIDAGAIKPNLAEFPLARVLDRLRLDFQPLAAEKGLRLRLAGSPVYVRSDPVLLERILRNLLSNAIRYTRQGGVLVAARRRAGAVSLEVWDTGFGIQDSERERIFEEFYQVVTPERAGQAGLGLGLAIIRRLCDLLGYRLRVNSRPGRGSVFRLEVPTVPAPALPPPRARAPELPEAELAGKLVVVIDDEGAIVEGMRALLGGWGAQVLGSSTGEDIVARLETIGRLPDLMIVDYRLAEGRLGTDTIDHLRDAVDPEIPAIIVTGSTTPDLAERVQARGDGLLLKPVLPATLRALIDAKLRRPVPR